MTASDSPDSPAWMGEGWVGANPGADRRRAVCAHSARARGCRDHVNRPARLLLASEGEALTRKAVELALAGDPTALRLCLERIVGPYRERAVEFTMPAIRGAADLVDAMAAVADAAAERAGTPRDAIQVCKDIEAIIREVE